MCITINARHGHDEGVAAPQMITSRMRFMSSQLETPLRIVGLSTSLANARDVGEWIGATSHGLFNFPPGQDTYSYTSHRLDRLRTPDSRELILSTAHFV